MAISRPLVVALALLVSPLGAAVCEIACGPPVHATAHAGPAPSSPIAVAEHHHHDQDASQDVSPALAERSPRVDASARADCDPIPAAPARIQGAFSDHPAHTDLAVVAVAQPNTAASANHPAVKSSPPSPPHPAPVPLRI